MLRFKHNSHPVKFILLFFEVHISLLRLFYFIWFLDFPFRTQIKATFIRQSPWLVAKASEHKDNLFNLKICNKYAIKRDPNGNRINFLFSYSFFSSTFVWDACFCAFYAMLGAQQSTYTHSIRWMNRFFHSEIVIMRFDIRISDFFSLSQLYEPMNRNTFVHRTATCCIQFLCCCEDSHRTQHRQYPVHWLLHENDEL